jgi:hypothetical protein
VTARTNLSYSGLTHIRSFTVATLTIARTNVRTSPRAARHKSITYVCGLIVAICTGVRKEKELFVWSVATP